MGRTNTDETGQWSLQPGLKCKVCGRTGGPSRPQQCEGFSVVLRYEGVFVFAKCH